MLGPLSSVSSCIPTRLYQPSKYDRIYLISLIALAALALWASRRYSQPSPMDPPEVQAIKNKLENQNLSFEPLALKGNNVQLPNGQIMTLPSNFMGKILYFENTEFNDPDLKSHAEERQKYEHGSHMYQYYNALYDDRLVCLLKKSIKDMSYPQNSAAPINQIYAFFNNQLYLIKTR